MESSGPPQADIEIQGNSPVEERLEDSDATARSTSYEGPTPRIPGRKGQGNVGGDTSSRRQRTRRRTSGTQEQEPKGTSAALAEGDEPTPANIDIHRQKRQKTDKIAEEAKAETPHLTDAPPQQDAAPAADSNSEAQIQDNVGVRYPQANEEKQALQPDTLQQHHQDTGNAHPGMDPSLHSGEATPGYTMQLNLEELKYSPMQLKAWIMTGQSLSLPGYQWPGLLPHVQMGARWQLDLRTGERLEEPNSAHINMSHLASIQGQHPNAFTVHNAALAAQALSQRTNLFSQVGSYGVVPPGAQYSSYSGQMAGTQGVDGAYNALLAPQILAQGLMAPHGAAQLHNIPAFQHMVQNNRQHRAVGSSQDHDNIPDIPLRRRGRPAGDVAGTASTPQELQERRMQANRAAASRSHFRRKREMEVLDKECAVAEARIAELKLSMVAMLQQEEQLRLNQQTIRNQLAEGLKPDESLSLPSVLHSLPAELAGRDEAEQAAFVAMLSSQLGTLANTPVGVSSANA